jgi:hypothetical protein
MVEATTVVASLPSENGNEKMEQRFWSDERCAQEGRADAKLDTGNELGPRGTYGNVAYDRAYREEWLRITGTELSSNNRTKADLAHKCPVCGAATNVMGRDVWGGLHPGKACEASSHA